MSDIVIRVENLVEPSGFVRKQYRYGQLGFNRASLGEACGEPGRGGLSDAARRVSQSLVHGSQSRRPWSPCHLVTGSPLT